MNFMNRSLLTIVLLSSFLVPLKCSAQEQHSWKDTNNSAIQAMRDGKYDESERLFQQALTECSDPDGKATIQDNIDVLMQKEGKKQAARAEKNEQNTQANSSFRIDGKSASPAPAAGDSVHKLISQLDAEIKKADESGDLEMLQALFQKRLQALKARDGGETLDYAYCLHFRAQVLQELHRDEEANALEASASRLRDALRKLSASPVAAPTKMRSQLSDLTFKMPPPPSNRPSQPIIENYANTTPVNRYAPHGFRNFTPANANNTSGYLNGNPNPPPGSW